MCSCGARLDCPHCPVLLHSNVALPQSDREVTWTWSGFKLKLSGVSEVSGCTHLRPLSELQHSQRAPSSWRSISQWVRAMARRAVQGSVSLYIFFQKNMLSERLRRYSRHQARWINYRITGIWWYPNESVISAATYDPFCFHSAERHSLSPNLISQQFWPPWCYTWLPPTHPCGE